MIISSVQRITPDVAKQYLECNKNNRNIRNTIVDSYARDMANGNWVVTHQGISFDVDGNLLDGQHRLMAVVKSGASIDTLVTTGLPKGSAAGIDQGERRNFKDVATMQYANETPVELRAPSVVATIRTMIHFGVNANLKLSYNEVLFLYNAFRSGFDVIYKLVNKKAFGGTSQVYAACLCALIRGEDATAIEKWYEVFSRANVQDCEAYNITAALNWRRQLDDYKIKGTPMKRSNVFLGTQNSIWNFCNDTEAKVVKIPKTPRYDVRDVVIKKIQAKG